MSITMSIFRERRRRARARRSAHPVCIALSCRQRRGQVCREGAHRECNRERKSLKWPHEEKERGRLSTCSSIWEAKPPAHLQKAGIENQLNILHNLMNIEHVIYVNVAAALPWRLRGKLFIYIMYA